MLPSGFTSRVIARSGRTVSGTSYTWHNAPDGGACYANGTGWIYVSNSEINPSGGASAVKFASTGAITGAYRILSGTARTAPVARPPGTPGCPARRHPSATSTKPTVGHEGGGPPGCHGPLQPRGGSRRPGAQGDLPDRGRDERPLPRFIPTTWGDLSSGTLQVLVAGSGTSGSFTWANVPSLVTNGAAPLTDVDNVTGSSSGDLFAAEDGGTMDICIITPDDIVAPFLRITGQPGSEICGPAFSPNGTRLYFSSQRGTTGSSSGGITYEVTGPFHTSA